MQKNEELTVAEEDKIANTVLLLENRNGDEKDKFKAVDKVCYACGQKGHFARAKVCKQGPKSQVSSRAVARDHGRGRYFKDKTQRGGGTQQLTKVTTPKRMHRTVE